MKEREDKTGKGRKGWEDGIKEREDKTGKGAVNIFSFSFLLSERYAWYLNFAHEVRRS